MSKDSKPNYRTSSWIVNVRQMKEYYERNPERSLKGKTTEELFKDFKTPLRWRFYSIKFKTKRSIKMKLISVLYIGVRFFERLIRKL